MTLLICGAGQYGLVAKEIAEAMGMFSSILFLDDNSDLAVGKLRDIHSVPYDLAIVALGDVAARKYLLEQITKPAVLIHPKAVVSPSAHIGEGSIVEAGAVIGTNARVGKGCIVMANAVVGHDARIGDYCQLRYNSAVPERTAVPEQIRVECNSVFDLAAGMEDCQGSNKYLVG